MIGAGGRERREGRSTREERANAGHEKMSGKGGGAHAHSALDLAVTREGWIEPQAKRAQAGSLASAGRDEKDGNEKKNLADPAGLSSTRSYIFTKTQKNDDSTELDRGRGPRLQPGRFPLSRSGSAPASSCGPARTRRQRARSSAAAELPTSTSTSTSSSSLARSRPHLLLRPTAALLARQPLPLHQRGLR